MWSMYYTVESTVQFCLQKPNVLNSTLLKNTYEVSLIQGACIYLSLRHSTNLFNGIDICHCQFFKELSFQLSTQKLYSVGGRCKQYKVREVPANSITPTLPHPPPTVAQEFEPYMFTSYSCRISLQGDTDYS